jgi:membrane-bound ClpP family serine protease
MSEELSPPQFHVGELHVGDLHERAVAAASALRDHATGANAPDIRHMTLARRISMSIVLGGLGLVVGAVLLLSFVASAAVPWFVGVALVLAVLGVVAVGLHAGGHGWFVPIPVLVLAGAWALTVSAGTWSSTFAWVLASLAFAGAGLGTLLILPAIAYRKAGGLPTGGAALVGASGTAVSALSPTGIARVRNETWTAESLSGPLPVGAPVHVARVEGLRLMVWSEVGNIPGPEDLGSAHQQKEDR